MMDQTISAAYLFSSAHVQDVGTLPTEEAVAFSAWFKALFDSNSEGIEDTILRWVYIKNVSLHLPWDLSHFQ